MNIEILLLKKNVIYYTMLYDFNIIKIYKTDFE